MGKQILEESKSVPRQIVFKAETKVERMESLRKVIKADMGQITERLQVLRQKITDNAKSESNLDGLLIRPQPKNSSSLFFETKTFEAILD